jgi:hypothetical protein
MMENNDEFYFDTEELEDIIVYYLELGDFNYADMAVNYGLKLHPNSLDIKIKKLEILEWEEYNTAKELIRRTERFFYGKYRLFGLLRQVLFEPRKSQKIH